MIRRNEPLGYPDGLVSVPLVAEWTVPDSLLEDPNSPLAEHVLGTVLSDRGSTVNRFRSLNEFRAGMESLDSPRVDQYLEGQLLPPLDSDAWRSFDTFVAERARLVLELLEDLQEAGRATVSGGRSSLADGLPWRLAHLPLEGLGTDEAVRIAAYLLKQGRSEDAASMLHLRLETLGSSARWEQTAEVEVMLARALAGSGRLTQAVRVLRESLRQIDNSQQTRETAYQRTKIVQSLSEMLADAGQPHNALDVTRSEWFRYSDEGLSARQAAEMLLKHARDLQRAGDREAANRLAREFLETVRREPESDWGDLYRAAEILERESSIPSISSGG
jgi:tetratricopeptide (TPR) repeat protein